MPTERIQRQIDALLDEAEQAVRRSDWGLVRSRAEQVLAFDPENQDALAFQLAAERGLGNEGHGSRVTGHGGTAAAAANREPPSIGAQFIAPTAPGPLTPPAGDAAPASSETRNPLPDTLPSSFVSGRYEVIRFLGEGGKKQVYLARDKTLNREVAFALIKTEGLDKIGRERIRREGEAMGALGAHPHIVTVFDLGELPAASSEQRATSGRTGQPYMVTELMRGGDVEGLIEKAPEHRLPLAQALRIADEVCQGLEFAHGKGIVHRDLKPGNVWLTEGVGGRESGVGEGAAPTPYTPHPTPAVAKIGDFGLAVSLDRTRLTQAGMMVGTVSYMPPEQATGGAVTPQSDLYSLGAMLYEMVAGRPPFLGDEIVAVIGQHLNVAPVSPAWHRHDCPPGLEALILRLLEKDPSRRPASATEVRAALASASLSVRDPSSPALLPHGEKGAEQLGPTADSLLPTASAENPLYRRVFVGRETELRQLQTAFDHALSGQGGLVMVVGEPGIGKTALVEQLATYATLRGGNTLWGHCYEEGSLSLPYLAFVEALRSYIAARPAEALRQELGSAAGDLARIVSEVRERLAIEPRPASEPEEDRWRLLQAVSGFLRNASGVQPLVIVLEDLHWADQGTLDLLTHLARNLQGARLLVVGSYRDVEVDRAHPLSAALADLRRQASFGRVQLRGLGTPEVQRMLLAITGLNVPGSLAEAIHRQTEGNPLFVQEVVRYLVEEGRLSAVSGQPSAAGPQSSAAVDMAIPEGLRDVIGRRLSRLSPECNRVLAIAAVIGRDFGLETLQAITEQDEEAVVSALEEALHIGVLEEQSRLGVIRYRFAHAFFRQTLYEELIAPRRLRLHQQVAGALEHQYTNRLEEHAAELAEHFAQSTDKEDLRKAVHYGELAAERALGVYAYGEAVRHLEQALAVQEVLDPDDAAKRCDLLLALGEALIPAGEPQRAAESVAPQALALAEALGDRSRASLACREAMEGLFHYAGGGIEGTSAYRQWAELAGRYAREGTAERAYADRTLGRIDFMAGRAPQARARLRPALDLARRLDDPSLFFELAWAMLIGATPDGAEEDRRLAEEVVSRPREGASAFALGQALWQAGSTFLNWGERERAETVWREMAQLGSRTRDPAMGSLVWETVLATLDGDLERALAIEMDAQRRAEGLGRIAIGPALDTSVFNVLMYLGRTTNALARIQTPGATNVASLPLRRAALAQFLAAAGRSTEAAAVLADLLTERGLFGPDAEGAGTASLVRLLDAAILIEDRRLAGTLARRLMPLAATGSSGGQFNAPTCIARHLGDAGRRCWASADRYWRTTSRPWTWRRACVTGQSLR